MRRLLKGIMPTPLVLARAHRRDVRRVRNRVFAELDAATRQDPPVLVFTMGKVGSRSVTESLRHSGLSEPLYHLHHIAGETNRRFRWRLRTLGYRQSPDRYIPIAIRQYIEVNSISFPWKIITLVRDPVARQVSGYFEPPLLNVGDTVDEFGRFKPEDTLAILESKLREPSAFRYHDTWFDREVKGIFGVDILNLPFDKTAGYAIHESPKANVLIMTLERLDSVFAKAIPAFVGIDQAPPLVSYNVRSETVDGSAYRWVKEHLRLPEDTLYRIYSSPTVKHFYDDDTVAGWVRYWSRPR